ncbi:PE-PPE domain-containing protein [Mycobacterium sp. DL592]|uniref:PE-PPE domain-containing protein n=1 Tax=Mycobacterium sp. DL592 TaxID=2675524 RepID=UPI0014218F33|nr:PE-PPE domain-containing protein [Mycobacterium sp. DL592]
MSATAFAGKLRGGSTRYAKTVTTKLALAGVATATATAAAVGLGPAAPIALADPTPTAVNILQDVYTTGPLAGILAAVGVTSIGPIEVTDPSTPIVGQVNLTLILDGPVDNNPLALYDTVNGLGFLRRTNLLGSALNSYDRIVCTTGGTCSTPNEFPAALGVGTGALSLIEAYRNQIASVQGNTPAGYTPFAPGPIEKQTIASGCGSIFNPNNCPNVQATNQTNQALLFVRNLLRPNGGIMSRFGPILNLFGVDTTVPGAGEYSSTPSVSPPGVGIKLNTATLDLTWAYDPLSDFPATLNPFSLLNTAFAALPTNLLGGTDLQGVDLTTAGLNIAGTLGILSRLTANTLPISTGEAWYGTLLPKNLPLLEPLRLPVRLINAVTKALGIPLNLGTPLADALQPALTILVNTGYTDVQTPTANGLYTRSFETSNVYTPFLSQAPLTAQEWAQVPGDVLRALVVGFQDAFPILRFGQPAPTLVVDGNHLGISYSASQSSAASTAVQTPAPEVSTPEVKATSNEVSDTTTAPADDTKPTTGSDSTPSTPGPSTGGAKAAKPSKKAAPSAADSSSGSAHKTVGASKRSAGSDAA